MQSCPGVDVLFTYSLEVKVMTSSVGKFHDVTTPTSSSLGGSRSQTCTRPPPWQARPCLPCHDQPKIEVPLKAR